MRTRNFPLEKIFGSRTRVKIITLFTGGVKRPYYVREISRNIDERLNAVRRELEILRKIGMLTTHNNRRRKYYVLNPEFFLVDELTSIMAKAGPGIEDALFKNVVRMGDVRYLCVSGYFTGAKSSPTDILLVGDIDEGRAESFVKMVEDQVGQEITYTPMTENEFKYRLNFNDLFLRSIFENPYKEVVNRLADKLQPSRLTQQESSSVLRSE
jgi:DNA-binding transcriptional ArsR family regulator